MPSYDEARKQIVNGGYVLKKPQSQVISSADGYSMRMAGVASVDLSVLPDCPLSLARDNIIAMPGRISISTWPCPLEVIEVYRRLVVLFNRCGYQSSVSQSNNDKIGKIKSLQRP